LVGFSYSIILDIFPLYWNIDFCQLGGIFIKMFPLKTKPLPFPRLKVVIASHFLIISLYQINLQVKFNKYQINLQVKNRINLGKNYLDLSLYGTKIYSIQTESLELRTDLIYRIFNRNPVTRLFLSKLNLQLSSIN